MFDPFHFIQPLWLLALLPLGLLLWLLSRRRAGNNPWRSIVDARLLPLLMSKQQGAASLMPIWLLSIGWLLIVLALANPTWERQPQPVVQTSMSRVIVFDLSSSMLAADLKPSRLARARYIVEDILNLDDEGQTGLVVFAGDAFTVTPLTRDADTIRAQLKVLEPAIMPDQGSRADLGLLKAAELLQQAGVQNGQVILIADGVEGDRAIQAAARLRKSGYRTSVLGVGTVAGAPLPDGKGGTRKTASGGPQLVRLDSDALKAVAQSGGGRYQSLSGNSPDIRKLVASGTGASSSHQSSDLLTQKWKEQGPLLAMLLLPFAALAFRRGWLLSLVLLTGLLSPPQQAMAFGWDDLWQRKDQQAAQALHDGQYDRAAAVARDPAQRGSAEYLKGDYQKALAEFSRAPGADAAYNRGNAQARLGKYQEAIRAYDESLQSQPGMQDAAANKAAVEELLKNQQKQQDQSGQQGEQDQKSDNKSDSSGQDKQNAQKQAGNEQSPSEQQKDNAHGDDNNPQQQGSGNQFADANKQLEQGGSDKQEKNEPASVPPPSSEQAAAKQNPGNDDEQAAGSEHAPSQAEELTSEEQLAAQQWLRRIPDDPGGLLRRKFRYQYQQRARNSEDLSGQDW